MITGDPPPGRRSRPVGELAGPETPKRDDITITQGSPGAEYAAGMRRRRAASDRLAPYDDRGLRDPLDRLRAQPGRQSVDGWQDTWQELAHRLDGVFVVTVDTRNGRRYRRSFFTINAAERHALQAEDDGHRATVILALLQPSHTVMSGRFRWETPG